MESWVSGPAIADDHKRETGCDATARELHLLAQQGDEAALNSFARHTSRLARGLAMVVNIFDPDIIVLGGGLSQLSHLYDELPNRIAPFVFAEDKRVKVAHPLHGDASGVRGAAWLWNAQ